MYMISDTKILSIDEIYDNILKSYCCGELTEGEWMMSPIRAREVFEAECIKHGYMASEYVLYSADAEMECEAYLDKLRTKFI